MSSVSLVDGHPWRDYDMGAVVQLFQQVQYLAFMDLALFTMAEVVCALQEGGDTRTAR